MKKILLICLMLIFTTVWASQTGSPCNTDSDCPNLHKCLLSGASKKCVHDDLFPIAAVEVIGTMVILVMNALLTAGGIGGGAAYVPYVMIFFSVTLPQAIAYAYACVFGGGLGNLVNIITLKSPKTKRFMINYDVNLLILPALMVGVMIGLILQRIFPPIVTNILLLLVLAYSFFRNIHKVRVNLAKEKREARERKQKALEKYTGETEMVKTQPGPTLEIELPNTEEIKEGNEQEEQVNQMRQDNQDTEGNERVNTERDELMRMQSPKDENIPINFSTNENNKVTPQPQQDNSKKAELERKELKFPYQKFIELLMNVLVIIIVGIIRGTKVFKPVVGVDWTCGWDFLWFAIGICLFGTLSVRSIYLVHKWQKEKIEAGYVFLPEEPILHTKTIVKILVISVFAGIIGAIVALGGALVLAPTLLDMGIPPAYSAVTTGVFMIFSMFNSMFQTILNKKIKAVELAWFLPLAFVFSYTSSRLVNYYIHRTGKQSTVILTVMLVTALGFGCVIYNLAHGLVDNYSSQTTFTSVC